MARKPGNRFLDRDRSIDSDEARLWQLVTGDVEPLGDVPRRLGPKPHEVGRGAGRENERAALSNNEITKSVSPARRHNSLSEAAFKVESKTRPKSEPAVLDRRKLRKIGKGHISIDDRIDLHGMGQAQAHRALLLFLRTAQVNRYKTVLVITGKGRLKSERSENWMGDRETGVLRREVPKWLRSDELGDVVLGFARARPQHGGEGALYVRLRKA